MRVIGCVNQKGGVGKTTLCANLAYALSETGARVLVIDMDPQGHLSQCFGFFRPAKQGVDALLSGQASISTVTLKLSETLFFVPSGQQLVRLEAVQMVKGRGLMLKKALQGLEGEYDYVLLDCPPSNGFLVVNAIAASTELLIPVTPDYLGMSGVSMMLQTLNRYENVLGAFRRKWIVISRMQKRRLSDEVVTKLRRYFPKELVPTMVTERAVLAECPSFGRPIMAYAPKSVSSKEFAQIAEHLATHEETQS